MFEILGNTYTVYEHAEWTAPARSGICIHTLNWALSVVQRSHTSVMFAHKFFKGTWYADDTLPNTMHLPIWMPALHAWLYYAIYMQPFSMLAPLKQQPKIDAGGLILFHIYGLINIIAHEEYVKNLGHAYSNKITPT
jgi:hypothetical protein